MPPREAPGGTARGHGSSTSASTAPRARCWWAGTGDASEALLADPSGDSPPVRSPDGRWIVWSSRTGSRGSSCLATADGEGRRRLTGPPEVDRYPTWSPDGTRLAFARRVDDGWRIAVLGLDGAGAPGAITWFSAPRDYMGHLAWSPDGTMLVFCGETDGNWDVWTVDPTTGAVTRLTEDPAFDGAPIFVPGPVMDAGVRRR